MSTEAFLLLSVVVIAIVGGIVFGTLVSLLFNLVLIPAIVLMTITVGFFAAATATFAMRRI